jgi:hypothetical protein
VHPTALSTQTRTTQPFALCTRAKSETWLRRKRTPDKRHALRINFQLKTRGQKRKITLMRLGGFRWRVLQAFALFYAPLLGAGFPFGNQKQNTHTNLRNQFVITWCLVLVDEASNATTTHRQQYTIEIWLILPVVICLFQGLSHACLRITALQESAHGSLHQTQSAAKLLRKRIIGYLVRNAKLIHELRGSSHSTRRRLAESVVADSADE